MSTTKNHTLLFLATFLALILHLPPTTQNQHYEKCRLFFNCGKLTGIDYPFSGGDRPDECGRPGLNLGCENGTATIQMNAVKYRVLDLNPETRLLKIARDDLSRDLCPLELRNTTLDAGLFEHADRYVNLTLLYGCPDLEFPLPYRFDCPAEGREYAWIGSARILRMVCRQSVAIPVSYGSFPDFKDLREVVREGFVVRLKDGGGGDCGDCRRSGGSCGYGAAEGGFVCFCPGVTAAASRICGGGVVVGAAGDYSSGASSIAKLASGMF